MPTSSEVESSSAAPEALASATGGGGPSGAIAPPNRRYAAEPVGWRPRLTRWCWRLLGQVRRQYLSRVRPGYVRRARELRRGECRFCGSCCDLTFHCWHLNEESRCDDYENRQLTCHDFPHDRLDLRLTQVPCGHFFDEMPEAPACRIPLTGYGVRELVVFGSVGLAGIVASAVWLPYAAPVFAVGLGFVLCFFRDPHRRIPAEAGAVVSPADGRVVEIGEVDDARFLKGSAVRIGIFMSPLDVHVNRSPVEGTVEESVHRPGRYLNAASAGASAENESHTLVLAASERDGVRVSVRQIAGVMARRIVCAAQVGDGLGRGERFGMVKFGSRAEVDVPVEAGFEVRVRLGQRVRAGETVLGVLR